MKNNEIPSLDPIFMLSERKISIFLANFLTNVLFSRLFPLFW